MIGRRSVAITARHSSALSASRPSLHFGGDMQMTKLRSRLSSCACALALVAIFCLPSIWTAQATQQKDSLQDSSRSNESGLFSQSEIVGRPMHDMPFSGGPTPNASFLLTPSKAEPAPLAAAQNSVATAMTRVNSDLLPPGPVAQPETQAEPFIAVNPQNPLNIVAAYQESRFFDGGARALNYATSFDGGATWTEGTLPNLSIATGGRWQRVSDPWVAFGP